MGKRLTGNLVSQSLSRAVKAKRPAKGLLHHSDHGSQYCSDEYRRILDKFGLQVSMSGTGNCFDNAPMESLRGYSQAEAYSPPSLQQPTGDHARDYRVN